MMISVYCLLMVDHFHSSIAELAPCFPLVVLSIFTTQTYMSFANCDPST